ncbi:putative ATP binding protein [Heracleum sosnowskyi]|uniref:ATP binding protein n=1 Tax=Heracleum sosnowskyi TaxID=360622 RepID=A0AAD8J813_9APIA|nr:putative ATP binding protein [Heracleum sosnowskyi]
MAKSQFLPLYITVCIVAFVISKIVIAVLIYRRWQRKNLVVQDSFYGGKLVMFRSSKMKSLKSNKLLKRTMKLSNKDKIGAGGYGTVYRLKMDDSTFFAVKRLNRGSAEQDRGFERELEAMGDIKHRNVVVLHGYYTAPHYNLLIYELMPNGSLDTFLHGNSPDKVLDWPSRYKIAVDKTHVSTLVAGTFGYLAPEYFDTGRATVKGDVYSYGVVLLELLTGRRPNDETFIEEGTKLVKWVQVVVQEKREEYVIDNVLKNYLSEEINAVFGIALMCLESDPTRRPTMAEVVKMLERIKQQL